ncbi:MAG TPA: GatB/YqeY domain-containing protein [Marmoricola sp.]|nr:GatB/YqeY domain-containing protein [Marmoricola sp.]
MSLKQQLRDDLTTAMKARDQVRSSTLRMVLTAVTNAEVAGKEAIELTDEQVLTVLSSEAKKRREAAVAFAEAGRAEAAAKEEAELGVILDYLPEQLDEAAIVALVNEVIDELGVRGEGPKAMGRVMGTLQPKVKGRADGGLVAAKVKELLA